MCLRACVWGVGEGHASAKSDACECAAPPTLVGAPVGRRNKGGRNARTVATREFRNVDACLSPTIPPPKIAN